jgi:hypothetical protein
MKKAPGQARSAAMKVARKARDLSANPHNIATGVAAAVGGAAGVVAGVIEGAMGGGSQAQAGDEMENDNGGGMDDDVSDDDGGSSGE